MKGVSSFLLLLKNETNRLLDSIQCLWIGHWIGKSKSRAETVLFSEVDYATRIHIINDMSGWIAC